MPQHEDVHLHATGLLVAAAAVLAAVHSVLPDHWVPLAVVARTQRWSMARLARVSGLAAGGHVLASLALAGVIALVGLQFQGRIESQQGHIVGAVLILTGLGFLAWGATGHGHAHGAEPEPEHQPSEMPPGESHEHQHAAGVASGADGTHVHEHVHGKLAHSHRHGHAAFVSKQAGRIVQHTETGGLAGHLAAIAVPFGVAASPDLTLLPVGVGASAYGAGAVVLVLAVFAAVTMATFVGLTLGAAAAGYQMRGEWLEDHANTITSLVLVAIGLVAFVGL